MEKIKEDAYMGKKNRNKASKRNPKFISNKEENIMNEERLEQGIGETPIVNPEVTGEQLNLDLNTPITEPEEVETETEPEEVETETEPEEVETETEPEEVETETEPEEVEDDNLNNIVIGKLNNCARLNIRAEASKESEVVTIIDDKAELIINLEESTEDFYKVECKGFVGFCVKSFIKID